MQGFFMPNIDMLVAIPLLRTF